MQNPNCSETYASFRIEEDRVGEGVCRQSPMDVPASAGESRRTSAIADVNGQSWQMGVRNPTEFN